MPAKILNISVPEEDFNYLKEDKLLSPSKIFQVALKNIKENRKDITEWKKKALFYQEELQKAIEFITLKELMEEWSQYDSV